MKRVLASICLVIFLLLLSGCAETGVPIDQRWASVSGGQIQKSQAGEEFYFNVPVDQSMMEPVTTPVHIRVSGNVNSGKLRFELRGPDGKAVWNSGTIGAGEFSINTDYAPSETGMYKLGLVYEANTSATYNLSWQALPLGPGILTPGVGMILVSLGFLAYVIWRRLSWRYLLLGALFWIITVALKFAFAVPVNPVVLRALQVSQTDLFSPGNLIAYLYIGALTGIFEAGLTWLILQRRWGKATWKQALGFGIGFGVVEALLLGFSGLLPAIVALTSPAVLPVPTLGGLARSGQLVIGLAAVVERLFVIFAHIFANVLIFYAIVSRQSKWGWLAILYKTLLDAPGGFAAFYGTETAAKLWSIEAAIAVFGLIGLAGTIAIAKRYPREEAQPTAEETGPTSKLVVEGETGSR